MFRKREREKRYVAGQSGGHDTEKHKKIVEEQNGEIPG